MKVFAANKIYKQYGDKEIIKDFTYTFDNKIYHIKGSNGSGKSTLIRVLSGLEKVDSGYVDKLSRVLYLNNDILGHKFLTLNENIDMLFSIHNIKLTAEYHQFIDELYQSNNMDTLLKDSSLGMQTKVSLSLLSVMSYWQLIILDETLSSIDKTTTELVLQQLTKQSQ